MLIYIFFFVLKTKIKLSGVCGIALDCELREDLLPCDLNLFSSYFSRAYSLVDSSQVSTFLISILLIVYGSFR